MGINLIEDDQLSLERLRELVSYDMETGKFYWIKKRSGVHIGEAGCIAPVGYIYINIDGTKYLAHRLAWLYIYGELPTGQIDHINCIRTDNRIANLRDVTPAINNQNRINPRKDNLSCGITGVSKMRNKWRARIVVDGKTSYLGVFDTIEEAKQAYITAKREMHVGCTI